MLIQVWPSLATSACTSPTDLEVHPLRGPNALDPGHPGQSHASHGYHVTVNVMSTFQLRQDIHIWCRLPLLKSSL